MKHLGDITKINWLEVEPVDVVTGGSPCQDLSVAGKRAGLAGERSGLFMEQIRCVKELREADVHRGRSGQFIRPRYMVWENVPGAFSSGSPKGADFAAVIEEIIKVAEPDAIVRVLPPDKGWPKSGCYYSADGRWSVAWRLHDAQFWGVPQRRKRIALVADFGGLAAPEILFERKGLSRDIEQSRAQRKETAGAVGGSTEGADRGCGEIILDDQGGSQINIRTDGKSPTLRAEMHGNLPCVIESAISFQERAGKPGGGKGTLIQNERVGALSTLNNQSVCYGISSYASNAMKSPNPYSGIYEADTARTLDLNGGNPACNQGGIAVVESNAAIFSRQRSDEFIENNVSSTQSARQYKDATDLVVENKAAVRRLTPLECERLQGYPDGWTDIGEWIDTKGKRHKEADGPRYKALGNSIALPFWKWLLKRISAQYERDATLGSLFDGIGGFPLCWEQINGKGSARWASEIEEFPIAVTKLRFGEE